MKAKKILAAFIATTMVLSSMSFTAFATDGSTDVPAVDTPVSAENWIDYANTDWYTNAEAETTEFTISSAEELAGLAAITDGKADGITKDTFAGKKITLGANIDLTSKEWTPIEKFEGEFNGADYTISNIANSTNLNRKGLFKSASGDIHNLKIDDVNFTCNETVSDVRAAALIGSAAVGVTISDVKISNVTIDYADVTSSGWFSGLVAEGVIDSQLLNVELSHITISVKNATGTGDNYISGVSGYGVGHQNADRITDREIITEYFTKTSKPLTSYFKNVDVAGLDVDVEGGNMYVGGIHYLGHSGNMGCFSFYENCDVTGLDIDCGVASTYTVGGLMAKCKSGESFDGSDEYTSKNYMENCNVSGAIDSVATNANSVFGGLFGTIGSIHKTVNDSTVDVDINVAAGTVAGAVGTHSSQDGKRRLTIQNSNISGDVKTTDGVAGGVVGLMKQLDDTYLNTNLTLQNTNVSGTVDGSAYAGGVVGFVDTANKDYADRVIIAKDNTISSVISGAVTNSIVNLSKEFYLDAESDTDKYVFGNAAAYVKFDELSVGYKTIDEAVAADKDNLYLLQNAEYNLTIDSDYTLGVGEYTLNGKITAPSDVKITVVGENENNNIDVKYNSAVEENNVFNCFTDEACTEKATLPITKAGVYYTKYEPLYTIEFTNAGDNGVPAVTDIANAAITYGDAPERVGYIFKGWTLGTDETVIAHSELPEKMPAVNRTYVGVWEYNPNVTTYEVVGDRSYGSFKGALEAIDTGDAEQGEIKFKNDNGNDVLVTVISAKTEVTAADANIGASAENVKIIDNESVYADKVEQLAKDGAQNIQRVDTVKYGAVTPDENDSKKLLLNVDIETKVNYTLNGEAETEAIIFKDSVVTVQLKVDDSLNGKKVTVTKEGTDFNKVVTVANGIVGFETTEGFSIYTLDVSALNDLAVDKITENINVVLKKNPKADNKGNEYELWLVAEEGKRIFGFDAAEFKFTYKNTDDKKANDSERNWDIKAASGISMSQTGDLYQFNVANGERNLTGSTEVKIADITFNRYGTITFAVEKDGAEVRTSHLNVNVPKAYNIKNTNLTINNTPNADGDKEDDAIIDGVIFDEEKVDVTINLEGLLPISNIYKVDYQDMTVTIERLGVAADETKVIRLGRDMKDYIGDNDESTTVEHQTRKKEIKGEAEQRMISEYIINTKLAVDSDYVITLEGAGYRTYTYKINKLKSTAVLTFWNDVKNDGSDGVRANTMEKVMESDAAPIKVTFLAGDIVNDGIIDVYDLNAAVSYWHYAFDATKADGVKFNKYDLNRDGKIDIDDVAMVIEGWNN